MQNPYSQFGASLRGRSLVWLLIVIVSLPANMTTYSESYSLFTKDQNAMVNTLLPDPIINPVVEQRADPWIYRHSDGYYYFTASVPEYDRIELRRAATIQELASASPVVILEKHATGIMSKHIWAPEIHYIDSKWYVYFAAARVTRPFDHRIYVLESAAANPLEGTWVEKGQIRTKWETFSLDATTFEHNGTRYLVWAQKDPSVFGNSNLYIAAMSNPWTLASEQVEISRPTRDWEIIGFWVNEGAAVIKRNGRIFITYSASATDSNYAMGLLTVSEDSDLLDPDSWSKSPVPVFFTNDTTGQYGPGHNSFTVSPEGDDLLVYHARNYKEISGDPLYDPNRHTRVQKLYWNEDGTPNFGIPVPDGPLPWRFRSTGTKALFIYHDGAYVAMEHDVSRVAQSQFRVVAGLADPRAISLESVDQPGNYLRHRDGQIWLEANDSSEVFAATATWLVQPGMTGSDSISFESFDLPNHYIHQREDVGLDFNSILTDTENVTFFLER